MDEQARKEAEIAVYNKEAGRERRAYGDYFDSTVYDRLIGAEYRGDFAVLAEKYLKGKRVLVLGASRQDIDMIWPYTQQITAVDISPVMIENLVGRYPSVEGVVGDAERLGDLEGKYEVVFCKSVLHHLHPLEAVLLGIAEKVENEGVLFVGSEPGKYHPFAWLGRRLMPSSDHTPGEEPFDYALYEAKLGRHFEQVWQRYYFLGSVMLSVLPAFVPVLQRICMGLVTPVVRLERWGMRKLGLGKYAWLTMGVYRKSSKLKNTQSNYCSW